LKENFDRFNLAIHKEKQMADFRRWFSVLAVLAMMACVASAQVGMTSGSANSSLLCSATGAGIPELRPEGYTELAGDIIISCTGGPILQQGAAIPTTNVVVYMAPSVPITSRFIGSPASGNGGSPSEALLIIDEAGANIPTGATANQQYAYGPNAVQSFCSSAAQQASGGSTCGAFVGMDGSGKYEVAVSAVNSSNVPGIIPAANVFQGKVGDYGPNSVTFYNVPVLPPASQGVSRVFRITNIRVPVPGGNLSGTLQAIISTSPNQTLPVAGTAINIGVVGNSMTAAVKGYSKFTPFQQCTTQTVSLTANLIYTEGFATAFKTRVVPGGAANNITGNSTGNVLYAAEGTNTASPSNQNIPGGLYGNFAANSESGFIFPTLVTSNTGTGAINYTAGLADYGTRLKAVFYNIPAGVTLYVSANSGLVGGGATSTAPPVIGGTSVLPYAVLVATNSGEATPDSLSSTGAFGIAGNTTSKGAPINGTPDGLPAVALSANSAGAATAVWEVTNSNPSAIDVLSFSVYISYAATSSSAANPYGLPITDLPLNSPVNDVQLSLAPEPGGGTFTTANATQGQTPIPRFAVVKTQEGRYTTISLCQTTLLYPFVTGASGFDTGIAVANTSWDPFGTVNQVGSCKLYGYGVTVASAGNTAIQTTVPGCDAISNPLPGTNCFAVVPSGQVMSVMASAVLTNFQGYVIAVCNFQFAHGYAAVTDLGLRNLWSSYLALELNNNAVGTIRTGTAGVENLVH
jgi:hypothetical protein